MKTSVLPAKRSILVTLDISDAGRLALDIAARMAAISEAELEGVFIEDIDLISLSKLPFLQEISVCSTMAENISPERMQRDLNAQARQAERMLIEHAKSIGVNYSFRIWRGQASIDTLSASFEADILSIVRYPVYRRRALAAQENAIENIYVIFSGSLQSERTLLAARQLASNLNVPLRVFLSISDDTEVKTEKKLLDILGAQISQTELVYFDDMSTLLNILKAAGNSVLFMESDHPLFRNVEFNQCLNTIATPVLIVR